MMEMIWLGVGVGFLANLIKSWLPKPLTPEAKLSLVFLLSILAALLVAENALQMPQSALGIAAVATFYHAVHKLIEAAGDDRRMATLRRR